MGHSRVFELSLDELGKLEKLIEESHFRPYHYLSSEPACDLKNYWLTTIEETIKSNQGFIMAIEKENAIVGFVVYGDLPWDSIVLEKRMGWIKFLIVQEGLDESESLIDQLLECSIQKALCMKVDCLLCKTYTGDISSIHSLERNGFLLMDTLLDYVYSFQNPPFNMIQPPSLEKGFSLRLAGTDDCEELTQVSRAAFKHFLGRFHADPNIPKAYATRIYEEWLISSCSGWADWILIAERDARIAGYSVWKKPSQIEQQHRVALAHLSIGAIHPDFHGSGLFSVLTYEGMKLLKNISDYIEGPTHINNYSVQKAYTKLGWKILSSRHSFHKWLKE